MNLRQHLILTAVRALATLLVMLIILGVFGGYLDRLLNGDSTAYQSASGGYCNIAVIPLQGSIESYDPLPEEYDYVTTSGDSVVAAIRATEADENIKGIMLQIDSSGGSPAAGGQIMKALRLAEIPTLAYIRSFGASSAYLAAIGADTIIASNYADVGSIGITSSYLQQTKQDAKEGLEYIQISSGRYKDTFDPSYAMTPDQRALAHRDVDLLAKVFIGTVAQNRHMATSAVEKLADGSSMPASLALANGLIDQVGDEETARVWFADKIGEDAILCVPLSR